jgi:hypothetical protein
LKLLERNVITEEDVQALKQKADCWDTEADVLDLIERRGGKDTRPNVVVSKKAFANVLFHSRPVSFDINPYIKVYTESFEVGQKELQLRLVALEADEIAKMSAATIELELLKKEYDDKLRALNLRIQVSEALEEDTKDATDQLNDALSKNVVLTEKVRKLEEVLRGVRNGSNILSVLPPADARVRPSDPSRESSSSVTSVPDGRDARKRDLSPSVPSNNAPPKKQRSEAWNRWNREGTKVATAWIFGVTRTILHGKTVPDLHALLAKVSAAADDFKSLFPLDNDPEDGIRYRNREPHSAFQNLHDELQIPSIAQGRAYALNFYYGKIIGTIHDVLVRRDNFKRLSDDADKLNTYMHHRGANHPDVVAFKLADDRQRGIERNAMEMTRNFNKCFDAVVPKGSPRPYWMTESTYRVLQLQPVIALSRSDVEEMDNLRGVAKGDFCRYYHNIYQHTIIEFYLAARSYDNKLRYSTKSSRGSNNKNFSNGGGPRASA